MRALLNQEVDMEELFEYNEDDEEDQEFSDKMEEEDKVDSDFDLDSSEGEQEHIEEGKAMDKQIALDEKRARRAATFQPPTVSKPKKPVERQKRSRPEDTIEERAVRYSSRKNTVLNRILVQDQLREHEKRRASQPKRDRPVVNKMTQEELLAEAVITEEKNKSSLLEWQQKEAERKANAKKIDKKGVIGPFIRYHSFTDRLDDAMGRNLVTFVEQNDLDEEEEDNLEQLGMIHHVSAWFEKLPKPNKPIMCPITGELAKYRDPSTGVPFADIKSYEAIKACLNHRMQWSPSSHLYLGNLPNARGVPDGW
ncbi:Vacuolar protein sorting-associated protein 72 [Rhizopus stolonifer]|uniref:Vacuolar protein sorting-associated protein 72 n=2 Tax=Mucorineae TaxID=1344963 RepID=A0A367IS96_RHIST|nr:Vacuolar protein sorting-associated protein 72 [Rhizopus stolonifer]